MKPCVTISLVPEARGGPFIFWDDLPGSIEQAARLGYAAVEIFPPSVEVLNAAELKRLLREHGLSLAAIGTGAGWVRHKLSLTSGDAAVHQRAVDFVRGYIDFAGEFGAAVIIGSMQGRAEGKVTHPDAVRMLEGALDELALPAGRRGATILYEPLNRYETNLFNRIEDVMPFVSRLSPRVKILADLFHMSIEEQSIAAALRAASDRLGHVHLADSNRRPAGLGHTDFTPIFQTLREMNYTGYVSAEALPYPTPAEAAETTLRAFHRFAATP